MPDFLGWDAGGCREAFDSDARCVVTRSEYRVGLWLEEGHGEGTSSGDRLADFHVNGLP